MIRRLFARRERFAVPMQAGANIATTGIGPGRMGILALISAAVAINYLDRALLGIAAPTLQTEMGLDTAEMGVLLSAFSWTYFASQIPAGILLDRFKVGVTYAASLFAWSAVTLLHAAVSQFPSLVALRFALGAAESPCFPANSKVVAMWFPRNERARAIAVYTAAEYVGLSFLSPVLFWILHLLGWRALFAVAGLTGIVFTGVFARYYSDPPSHPAVDRAAPASASAGSGVVGGDRRPLALTARDIMALLRHRQMWGLCIGQFAVYSTFVFFLTWFPTYLATERHMGWIQVGAFTALPYIAGFCGILFAGWGSDFMLARGCALGTARKLPVILGLAGAATIMLANFTDNNGIIVAILSLAFFCQAMSSSGWSVLAEIAPPERLGVVGGLFNASANLSGIVVPLVIGVLVKTTGSFVSVLVFVGVIAMIGMFSWIFLVGELKPMTGHEVLRRQGAQAERATDG